MIGEALCANVRQKQFFLFLNDHKTGFSWLVEREKALIEKVKDYIKLKNDEEFAVAAAKKLIALLENA